MSTDNRDQRLTRRMADLYVTDQQFADARPNEAIAAAINQPGVRMPELVRTVMENYADRPALGQRAVEFVTDPGTGRTALQLVSRFDHHLPRAMGPRRSDRGCFGGRFGGRAAR